MHIDLKSAKDPEPMLNLCIFSRMVIMIYA
jgi:hypothetical protein